jgi:hypothetical protein
MHARTGLCTAVATAMLVGLAASPPAVADGDPASDFLIFQRVFFPYQAPSALAKARLLATVAASKRAGYPLRVAVVQDPSDLGAVPQLFGKPQLYARFLGTELGYAGVDSVLLVVMRAGYGVSAGGRVTKSYRLKPRPVGPLVRRIADVPPPKGGSPDDLTEAAVGAVRTLAAGAGHPLPRHIPVSVPAAAGHAAGRGEGSGARDNLARSIAAAMLAVLAICALVLAGVAAHRYRTRPPAGS